MEACVFSQYDLVAEQIFGYVLGSGMNFGTRLTLSRHAKCRRFENQPLGRIICICVGGGLYSLTRNIARAGQVFVDMNILKPETDGQRTDAYLPLIGTL